MKSTICPNCKTVTPDASLRCHGCGELLSLMHGPDKPDTPETEMAEDTLRDPWGLARKLARTMIERDEARAIAEAYRDNLVTTIRSKREMYKLPWENP